MAPLTASPSDAFPAEYLDTLEQARSVGDALRRMDEIRLQIAPGSVFSIQQNVTTSADAPDEIRLRRFYSSQARQYPVNGIKRKTFTPWTERLFLHGLPFVGEGADVLACHFDDYEQMRSWGLQSVVNVPLMQGNTCYATFNVFGIHPRWKPQQVLGIRLLALAAARWVPAARGLAYRLADVSLTVSLEA
jgi:hypothetical protein